MPNKDNDIDYQMYLDYLENKKNTTEPKPTPKTGYAHAAAKPDTAYGYESRDEYKRKMSRARERESFAPEIHDIEKRYNLDPDGEDRGSHIMTDDEFEEKYGSGKKRKKKISHEDDEAYEDNSSFSDNTADRRAETDAAPALHHRKPSQSAYQDVYSSDEEHSHSSQRPLPTKKYGADENEDEPHEKNRGGKGNKGGKNNKNGKNGKKRKWPIVLVIILLVLAIAGTVCYVKRDAIISFVGSSIFKNTKTGTESTGVLKRLKEGDDKNHGDIFYETSASETGTMEEWIDSWAKQSGKLMYNDKIVNVLLIGMDDPNGDKYGRSDSMIIVSIDTKNQKLKMTSVWRDTYGLIQVPKTSDHAAYNTHEKINGSNFYGGPNCTVQTIENLYKVRIDGWVMTTFSSFKELIDAMGGINVEVTTAENNFLTQTAPVSWHGSAGKSVHLDGKEALVYARIRHLDSDIMRTERQRKVISAIIKKAGNLSTGELFKSVTKYLDAGYVSTNFSKDDVTGLGTKAVFGGWKDFKIQQMTAPISTEVDESNGAYYKGGTYNGAWVWLVDFPKTATDVQKFIYGETFCELNSDRHSISEFLNGVN